MKLLIFTTAACPKCTLVFHFLKSRHVAFERLDVDKNTEMARNYRVMSVPMTILADEEGKDRMRSLGVNPPELMQIIEILKAEGGAHHVS